MSQVGLGNQQPVQHIPGQTPVYQSPYAATNTGQVTENKAAEGQYPYGDDVFSGQYSNFKSLYNNFDPAVSKYSPFYGKINSNTASNSGNNTAASDIPASLLNQQNTQNNTQTTNIPANLNNPVQNNQVPVQNAPVHPKKQPPSGPVSNDIQQVLQGEIQKISTPQKAIEVVASHAMISRQERTMTNDVAWGARYYANQAAEMAESLSANKANLTPGQVQSQKRNIENLKIKSISMLNEAKKRAISTYNEALKSTMLYNHFFAENGQYASVLGDSDRQFVEGEIDKTWSNWQGGFTKDWQGQQAHANEAPLIIDNASREVATAIDKADKILATIN